MAIPSASTLKLSILLIILLAFEARETIAIGARVRVTIENNVRAPNPTTMTVHCKSKDDDLGSDSEEENDDEEKEDNEF